MYKINSKLKVYFLMINLIVSIIAFSYLISADSMDSGGKGTSPPGDTNINPGGGGDKPIDDKNNNNQIGVGGADNGGKTGGDGTSDTSGDSGGDTGGGSSPEETGWGFGNINLQTIVWEGTVGAGIFGTIGSLYGGENGALWGSISGAIGGAVAGLLEESLGTFWSTVIGLTIATAIFILTYHTRSQEIVEFSCLPWQAPIGGGDCQSCNSLKECSEYSCKSLGQACDIINSGTPDQKCIWKNPNDVNSPIIKMTNVSAGLKIVPDNSVRPPATGVRIKPSNADCVKAYFPLEFSFTTKDEETGVGEPSQCKIDYNLTSDPKTAFDSMAYYVGGNSLYSYNHGEKLSLPGPDAINAVAPVLKNNGEYNLFIRCRDANGNFNQDAFSVSFCVEKGPDTTAPVIVDTNVKSGSPIQFNQTKLALEIYINEPSECRWSRIDQKYEYMENNMSCDTNVWDMNSNLVYTCRTTLNGIKDRQENDYYIRCKDQPFAKEGDRNANQQSYRFKVIGTQPLNIMSISPKNETISDSTDTVPVILTLETDNGYNNGEALCYYHNGKPVRQEDYILFLNTSSNYHTQRQDLGQGNYNYYFKCVDLGGNTAYNSTTFHVNIDRTAPSVIRVYRNIGDLKIITDEKAECSYSTKDCNFEIESGIKMTSFDSYVHTTEWKYEQNEYIRCKDNYENQPNPNQCSIAVRASQMEPQQEAIDL